MSDYRSTRTQEQWRQMLAASFHPAEWFQADDGGPPVEVEGPDERETLMWVFRRSETSLYTVGYYAPDRSWHPEGDYPSKEEAAARVHWLNGGGGPSPEVQAAARRGFNS